MAKRQSKAKPEAKPADASPPATDSAATTATLDPPAENTQPEMAGDDQAEATEAAPFVACVEVDGLRIEAVDGSPLNVTPAKHSMFAPKDESLRIAASQRVTYYYDELGRTRGADVLLWKEAGEDILGVTYVASIRWEDGQFHWYERDDEVLGGWRRVKRGQHQQMVVPIVEQAIEYGIGRVLGSWVV